MTTLHQLSENSSISKIIDIHTHTHQPAENTHGKIYQFYLSKRYLILSGKEINTIYIVSEVPRSSAFPDYNSRWSYCRSVRERVPVCDQWLTQLRYKELARQTGFKLLAWQ